MAFSLNQPRLSSEIKDDDTHEPLVHEVDDGVSNHSMLSSLIRPKSSLSNMSLLHGSILSLLLVTGVIVGILAQGAQGPASMQHSHWSRLLLGNSVAMVLGFGIAIYGCVIYRQRQAGIREQVQLGPYTLHELIGSGGMGDVYLAEHRLLKRKCAIKLIRRDKASDRRMLTRFEREVKATAQLTHWNTVQVYDYGRTSKGTFYYAMEYLQGLNLRQLVEQFGPQSPARTIYILRQLCGALHEAHSGGLVHRDVKPSNVFLTERGQVCDVVKLLDFGLVRPARFGPDAICCTGGELQGSPRFMCPEQARGQKPDSRGDIYSLAAVGFYLLSGRPPFEDENSVMLVLAHATVQPPRLVDLGLDIPQDLSDIIARCLSKNAADRYQTPRELQDALEQCDSADDWTWRDAENWWRHQSMRIRSQTDEQTNIALDTQHADRPEEQEPDETLIPPNRMAIGGVM